MTIEQAEQKRGPGRPPNVKKGKAVWRPARRLDLNNKEPDWGYRWMNADDPRYIESKMEEGWVVVNKTTGIKAEKSESDGDGNPLAGAVKTRELVAMALPPELKEAREEYFTQLTDARTIGMKKKLDEDLSKGGPARAEGKIVIE